MADVAFGGLLKQLRRQTRLTQEELAERTGYSVGYIGMLERGVRLPPPETILLLAHALGLQDADQHRLEQAAGESRSPGEPSTAGPGGSPRAIPFPLTALLGREQDLERLGTLLQQQSLRLLTLTGPGGVGKTRLALEIAHRLEYRYRDGVVVVQLAPVTDPATMIYALAQALGVREASTRSLEEILIAYLSERDLLLLLDNFEHVLEAAPLLTRLLETIPSLRLLVTSRSPLRLRGEQEYAVPPLAVPAAEPRQPADELRACCAVQLFEERATAVRHDLALGDSDLQAVAEICRRLDGLPLAIELAAARIRLFLPRAMLERLTAAPEPASSLRLLTGGAKDLPPRLQTLQGAIDWSYALLGQSERGLFARLSVFAGGWTLEGAQAVDSAQEDPLDVLDLVGHLVDQSLVLAEARSEGTVRYRMLEPIRQYAYQQLVQSGEADTVHRRHAALLLTLAEAAEPELAGPDQATWLDRLQGEMDNTRAALVWARSARGDPEMGLRLAARFSRLLLHRGNISEARDWLEDMLNRATTADPALRARSLQRAGVLAGNAADAEAATSHFEQALKLFRALHDETSIAWTLAYLADLQRLIGDNERRRSLAEQALALSRKLHDKRLIAVCLGTLGNIAEEGGDFDRARALGEEGLSLNREIGNVLMVGIESHNLSVVARMSGDHTRALALCAEALSIFVGLKNKAMISATFGDFATLAYEQGTAERAVRLFAAATALREQCGFGLKPAESERFERSCEELRHTLGEGPFQDAWSAGSSMPLDVAVDYALIFDGERDEG